MVEVDAAMAAGSWEAAAGQATSLLEDAAVDTDLRWRLHQRAGLAYQELKRYPEALAHLEKAVVWAQTVPENHRNLATLLMEMGHSGRAMAEYREACDLAPQDWNLRVEYGHVLLEYGQASLAERFFYQAESLCADCAAVHRALARLAILREDYAAALPHLERLVELDPTETVQDQLALARLRCGDPDGARLLLLHDWEGRSAYGLRILLEADLALSDPTRALQLASSGWSGGESAEVWAQAALICIESGENEPGLALIDRAVAAAPGNVAYRHNRVLLLRRLGRMDEADAEWARVLALDPSRAEK
jgi:tetratricopeptide (TPR) repeat protein